MRRQIPLLTAAVPFAMVATLVSGCGAASPENLAEELIEKGLESEGVDNVEIDLSDNEDGEVTLNFEDEDGNAIGLQTGQQLPEGWPEDQPVPDAAVIAAAHSFTDDGVTTYSVVFEAPADQYDGFKEHFLANNASRNMTAELETVSQDGKNIVYTWGTESDVEVSLVMSSSPEGTYGNLTVFGR